MKTEVISVRVLPWVRFRTEKLAHLLGKSASEVIQEALAVHLSMAKIDKLTMQKWLTEYHKEHPNEVD